MSCKVNPCLKLEDQEFRTSAVSMGATVYTMGGECAARIFTAGGETGRQAKHPSDNVCQRDSRAVFMAATAAGIPAAYAMPITCDLGRDVISRARFETARGMALEVDGETVMGTLFSRSLAKKDVSRSIGTSWSKHSGGNCFQMKLFITKTESRMTIDRTISNSGQRFIHQGRESPTCSYGLGRSSTATVSTGSGNTGWVGK